MFTGIIENLGIVTNTSSLGANKTFWIQSAISPELKVDQSLSHDGVCLTVEEIQGDRHRVTAVEETLSKTVLNEWGIGRNVNLERSLLLSSRLDGHFVQGHVDTTGICQKIKDRDGSKEYSFSFNKKFRTLVIETGSISINGVSLTVFDVKKNSFRVAIIPYTLQHTNLQFIKKGDAVNLEYDMIGKYIVKQKLK